MTTNIPQNALKVLGFLDGDFFLTDNTGQSRGFRMIFGVLGGLKLTCSQMIPRIYIGITSALVSACAPDSIFRFMFGGLLLPFVGIMVFFHTHLYNGVLPFLKTGQDLWTLFYLCFLAMLIINYLLVLCTGAHDFNNSHDRVELEEAVKKNPVLNKKSPKCSKCGIPNVMRANHCPMCNTHTAKYHKHSLLFNKCIGAGNMLFYTSFQFFLAILLLIGTTVLIMEKDDTFTMGRGKKMLFRFLIIFYLVGGLGRLLTFAKNVAYIYFNITEYEAKNRSQLAYLWKSMQKDFFNPFDKGPSMNFKEELHTIMNHNEESNKKKGDRSMDEQELVNNAHDLEDRERKALEDERNKIVNWRSEKILALTDVYNSPMRKFFLDYLNKKKMQKGADSDSD